MRVIDKNITYGTRISEHIWKDNNGQLVCNDCVLARTGEYKYLEKDIVPNSDSNKVISVYRKEEDVFDPKSIASFENKPLCNNHPDEDVCCSNYKQLQCGYLRDVHRGTGEYKDCLLGTLIVTDENIIDLILSGEKRELSLGYDTEIVNINGKYYMTHIRGNHIALVDSGRAGCATIRDRNNLKNLGGVEMQFHTGKVKLSQELKKKLFDAQDDEIVEVTESVDADGNTVLEPCECEENITVEPMEDDDMMYDDESGVVEAVETSNGLFDKLDRVIMLLEQLVDKFTVVSEESVPTQDEDETVEVEEDNKPQETSEEVVVEEETKKEEDNDNVLYDQDEETKQENMCDEDDEDEDDEDEDDVSVTDSAYASLIKATDSAQTTQASIAELWQQRYNKKLNSNN